MNYIGTAAKIEYVNGNILRFKGSLMINDSGDFIFVDPSYSTKFFVIHEFTIWKKKFESSLCLDDSIIFVIK